MAGAEPVDPVEPVEPVVPVEPVLPPVTIVPGPLKLTLMFAPFRPPEPVRAKDPVAPEYVPVPPVMVADPDALVAPERIAWAGSLIEPVRESALVRATVKGALRLPLESTAESVSVVENAPEPTPLVNDAVPVRVMDPLVRESG